VGRHESLFPCSDDDWLIDRPQTVRVRTGSLSLEANSPTKFLLFNHCSRLSARATTYLGFCPPLDITASRPPARGIPYPHFVPSTGDLSLSTACSATQLAGLFHPTAEFRTLARPGVCPLLAGVLPHRKNSAPSSLGTGLLTCEQVATNLFPDPEALLHKKPCTLDSVVSLLAGHSPLRVLVLLQVLLPPQLSIPRKQTPMTFARPFLQPRERDR
jgi:hypothetical protein